MEDFLWWAFTHHEERKKTHMSGRWHGAWEQPYVWGKPNRLLTL